MKIHQKLFWSCPANTQTKLTTMLEVLTVQQKN